MESLINERILEAEIAGYSGRFLVDLFSILLVDASDEHKAQEQPNVLAMREASKAREIVGELKENGFVKTYALRILSTRPNESMLSDLICELLESEIFAQNGKIFYQTVKLPEVGETTPVGGNRLLIKKAARALLLFEGENKNRQKNLISAFGAPEDLVVIEALRGRGMKIFTTTHCGKDHKIRMAITKESQLQMRERQFNIYYKKRRLEEGDEKGKRTQLYIVSMNKDNSDCRVRFQLIDEGGKEGAQSFKVTLTSTWISEPPRIIYLYDESGYISFGPRVFFLESDDFLSH